jgi:hypothetical protein
MGMYDSIRVEMALPDIGMVEDEFQTKDLDCALDHYRITADGRLECLFRETEAIPEAERVGPFPLFRVIREEWVPHVHHGFITFYAYPRDKTFTANFAYGRLVGIREGEPTAWLPDGGADPWEVLAHIAEGLKHLELQTDQTERLRVYAEAALRGGGAAGEDT